MTATNIFYNFVGFRYSPPLSCTHRRRTTGCTGELQQRDRVEEELKKRDRVDEEQHIWSGEKNYLIPTETQREQCKF